MRRVKTGIIGCGFIGRTHLQFGMQAEHMEVIAVADVNIAAAQALASDYRIPAVYDDGFALIDNPEVEAVVLAIPTGTRLDLTLHALRKGKHVLLEKPSGMDAREVETIIRARNVAQDLVVAASSVRFRFPESARVLSEFIESGALGELRIVRCRSVKPAAERPTNPPYWRFNRKVNGGGIMANWGTYDLDFLFGVTGGRLRPVEVSARVWSVPSPFKTHVAEGSDAETHVTAFIQCESGTVVTLERGECIAGTGEDSWEIIGEKGSLSFRMAPMKDKAIVFLESDSENGIRTKEIWRGDESYDMIHAGLIEDFAAAIVEQRSPLGRLEEAWGVQRLIDAIYASSELSRAVRLD